MEKAGPGQAGALGNRGKETGLRNPAYLQGMGKKLWALWALLLQVGLRPFQPGVQDVASYMGPTCGPDWVT